MGYIRHDAIIVTAWDKKYLLPAIEEAERLELPVSDIAESKTNGYCSFLIAPDGSKEGWEESARGDAARASWKIWAAQARSRDVWLEWVHVSYAGDEPDDTKIIEQGKQ